MTIRCPNSSPGSRFAMLAAEDGSGRPIMIWRLSDGRKGHDKQTLGLAEALSRRTRTEVRTIPAPPFGETFVDAARGRFRRGEGLSAPSLILGAGHRTHVPMLAARRAHGGLAVVLMRPTLPMRWFDVCFVPEHDLPPPAPHIVPTVGALNRVIAGPSPDPAVGLVVVGGPSRHHSWDGELVLDQVRGVLERDPGGSWTVADSPRTPAAFREALSELCARLGVPFRSFGESTEHWLDDRFAVSGTVWVTEDSVSMIYEALTAGAAVGLLEVPRRARGGGRVSRGVDGLIRQGRVTQYEEWVAAGGTRLRGSEPPLREADRCAELLLGRLGVAPCV